MRPLGVDAYYARLEREYEAATEPRERCSMCGCARCPDPCGCEDAARWAEGEAQLDARDMRDAGEVWSDEDVCPI